MSDIPEHQNRALRRAMKRTDRHVQLADVVDWQSGPKKGATTEGLKASVRAVKRVSGGRRRG